MAEVERLLAEAEAAYQESLFADMPKTYEEVLATLDRELYYGLADLNGDGEDEILVGMEPGSIGQIYTKIGGSYILYTMIWEKPVEVFRDPVLGNSKRALYLCQDGIFEHYCQYENGSFFHAYSKLGKNVEKDGTSDAGYVRYDAETGKWHSSGQDMIYDEATGTYVPYERNDVITEDQARAVIAAHPRTELELKPVGEFFGNQ